MTKQARREAQAALAGLAAMTGRPTPAAIYELIAPARKRKPGAQSEHRIQAEVILWWHYQHVGYRLPEYALYACPSGGARNAVTGSMLKAEGVRPGIPDLFLAAPREPYSGLFLELKRPGGRASDVQLEFLNYADGAGYRTAIADSFEAATAIISGYLNGQKA